MAIKLYPIGTVVSLSGAAKKLMIIGIMASDEEGRMYDYLGLPFPEGYIDSETMFLFSHKDIEEVHFLGYVNADVQQYRAELLRYFDEKGIKNN